MPEPPDSSPSDVADKLARAYALETPDDNRALYRDWAATYDEDFIGPSGYVYHHEVAALLIRGDRRPDPVLDVGCGTGVAGLALRQLIDTTIDGIDLSPEMLDQARTKTHDGDAVYRDLIAADLTQPLPAGSAHYGGVLSTGLFTHGHLGPAPLTQLVALGAPGCRFAIGVNAHHYRAEGFDIALDELSNSDAIENVELVPVPIYTTSRPDEPDSFATVIVFDIPT